MWLYFAVASAILAALTLPVVVAARVALVRAHADPETGGDSLDPELRALIERYG